MPQQVLFIDDDHQFLSPIVHNLQLKHMVQIAPNFVEAQHQVTSHKFDLVVTELFFPSQTGIAFIEFLRRNSPGPSVIVMSSHSDAKTTEYFSTGVVHAFLAKPITSESLLKKIENCFQQKLREKMHKFHLPPETSLQLDMQKVTIGNKTVLLTTTEAGILKVLMECKNQVVSHQDFIRHVWSGKPIGENVVHTHLSNLKKKVPALARVVRTVRSRGIVWEE